MRSRSKGHAAVGGGSAMMGAACLVLGIARPAFASGNFLETPIWALLVTAGSVLTLAGVFILIFTFRAVPEEPDVVPAHVAFNSRMVAAPVLPPTPSPRAASPGRATNANASAAIAALGTTAAPTVPPRPTPRLQPPPAPAQQRVAPSLDDIQGISTQIQELTKRINKAGVMLATGQLSQEGYLAYVDDLKRQRGNLEAARVRHELRTS